jgi:hypothetical protein
MNVGVEHRLVHGVPRPEWLDGNGCRFANERFDTAEESEDPRVVVEVARQPEAASNLSPHIRDDGGPKTSMECQSSTRSAELRV